MLVRFCILIFFLSDVCCSFVQWNYGCYRRLLSSSSLLCLASYVVSLRWRTLTTHIHYAAVFSVTPQIMLLVCVFVCVCVCVQGVEVVSRLVGGHKVP